MTIASVRVTAYSAPYEKPITNGLYTYTDTEIVVCELETADGITGVGWTHGGAIVFQALRQIAESVVGLPLNTERIWAAIYRPKIYGRRGLSTRAISAVDIAVWDAIGKQAGMSVHRLLGGYRDRVPAYAAGGYYEPGKTLDDLQDEMRGRVDDGVAAVKMKVGGVPIAADLARVDAVIEAVGDGVDVLVDANNAYDRIGARRMARALGERGVYWFEEPLGPDDFDGAAALVAAGDVPIALGENEYTLPGFRHLVDTGCADVLNADAQILGGITEWQKSAHYALAHDTPVAPHGDQEIHVHLVAAVPNGLIVEYYDNSLNTLKDVMFEQRLELNVDGTISVPDRPGLGFDLDRRALEPFKVAGA
ncbi:mandelate racemase/muconate lactonizing enzyme family protein [Jiangella mangrovi]|uniref:D-arabinonate dehydratase n=1 Tax=Jiangella mangrovi TaxID=1524084 RepID=A0A7W9LM49_9ACTN|nr:mandelate racemase/muconate lactonizing enzyme family protein [Jiangella mangrovi]MBB5788742.1 D-arabinonate dehydratase [Jiangella mangrovi]